MQEVYGSATKSNNNSWLRRKLYEAVGVAPLKASTKGKARKPGGSSGSRKSAAHREAKAARCVQRLTMLMGACWWGHVAKL